MPALFRIFGLPTCRVFSWKRIPVLPRMMLFTLSGNLSQKDVGCTVNTAAGVVRPIRPASEGLIHAGCEQQPPHTAPDSGFKLPPPEQEIKPATRNHYLSLAGAGVCV